MQQRGPPSRFSNFHALADGALCIISSISEVGCLFRRFSTPDLAAGDASVVLWRICALRIWRRGARLSAEAALDKKMAAERAVATVEAARLWCTRASKEVNCLTAWAIRRRIIHRNDGHAATLMITLMHVSTVRIAISLAKGEGAFRLSRSAHNPE